LKIYRAGKIA
jgi:hypothetical protein